MALAVIAVTRVTGAHHPTKMVSALLLAGGASAHVIICRDKSSYFSRANAKQTTGAETAEQGKAE